MNLVKNSEKLSRDKERSNPKAYVSIFYCGLLHNMRNLEFGHIQFCDQDEKCDLLLDFAAAAAASLQSCPTLCILIDGSPPGSPIPGILQARTLEWVAISFSNV